jgi:hypothetical protein
MRKSIGILSLFVLCLAFSGQAFAMDRGTATSAYAAELEAVGMDHAQAGEKAAQDVDDVVKAMQGDQSSVSYGYDLLDDRVSKLLQTDKRKDSARDALDKAEDSKNAFTDMDAERNLFVQESIGGAPPAVMAGDDFQLAQKIAEEDQSEVNRVLIAPDRPGAVPAGDLVSDFLPQIIRQLFRFAWLAVLVALTVSGIMFVMSHDEDERITKAKNMLTYSLIGFAAVSLAFALVKALTNIDFFNFV